MSTSFRNDSQFGATKLWISILEKFYSGMPLARHRRQLRVFHDTFTGKDAVDFLLNFLPSLYTNRECTRQTAINLLQFYLNYNYLVNVRNEEDVEFHDNITLYSFRNEKIERFIKDRDSSFTTRRVRRVSSLRTDSISSYSKNSDYKLYSDSKFMPCSESSHAILQNRKSILSDQSHTSRLSMSCNDLTRVNQESGKPSTSYLVQHAKLNLKFLCNSVLKSSENVKNTSLNSIRGVSPLIQRISSSRSSKPPKITSSPSIVNNTPKHSQNYMSENAVKPRRYESVYMRKRLRPSSTPPKLLQTFCNRIDSNTFEAQRYSVDSDLLKLLDSTIADENIKPAQKNEFLKTFRTTYPRIYSIRFPEEIKIGEASTDMQGIRSKNIITRFYQMIV